MADDRDHDDTLIQSMAGLEASNDGDGIEYATIDGFKPGTTLRIASLTAGDLIEFSEHPNDQLSGLRLITKSLVDARGVRYADAPENVGVFRRKNHKATQRIVEAILKLNGIEVKVASAAKNASGGLPGAASSTVLR